jgi:hypothetical protein
MVHFELKHRPTTAQLPSPKANLLIMVRDSRQTSEAYLLNKLEHLAALPRSVSGQSQLQRRRLATLSLNQPPDSESSCVSDEWADLSQTAKHRLEINGIEIWLSGSSLLCRCPTCRAPLTIQTWLGLADCWQCQTSIALTDEQLAAAQTLPDLEGRVGLQRATDLNSNRTAPMINREPNAWDAIELPTRTDPSLERDDWQQRELESLARGSKLLRTVRRGLRLTPAWLLSMLVHLFLILLLALIILADGKRIERITLSTFLSPDKQLGGKFHIADPQFQLQDDLEMASLLAEGDEELRDVIQKAAQDAQELVNDPSPRVNLPDLERARQNLTNRADHSMSFAARDPRVRSEIVAREGGTTLTEAAVARGLRWLVSVQNQDGSWSLTSYDRHDNPRNKGDVMGTSLALLPLLGAGQTHEYGIYKDTVASGLAWLIDNQLANGDLRAGFDDDAGMYAHGQAAIVLCEALALTGDERLRQPAQLAVQFIEEAQHRDGGWRYQPGQPGDTSVFGWQMMALQSARSPNLNLKVNEETLRLADYFLDTVASSPRPFRDLPEGAAYAYSPGREATPAMTAEAILCRMYLGWDRQDARLSESIKWLIRDHLPSEDDRQLYYWYYGTQVMHHYGGRHWKTWNNRMREILISTQETRGRFPGSWDTDMCQWGSRGGRIYTTSLACCILEVYYRHLPLFSEVSTDKQ